MLPESLLGLPICACLLKGAKEPNRMSISLRSRVQSGILHAHWSAEEIPTSVSKCPSSHSLGFLLASIFPGKVHLRNGQYCHGKSFLKEAKLSGRGHLGAKSHLSYTQSRVLLSPFSLQLFCARKKMLRTVMIAVCIHSDSPSKPVKGHIA